MATAFIRQAESAAPEMFSVSICQDQHDWLVEKLFRSHKNRSPVMRMPDLLGACIDLALQRDDLVDAIQRYFVKQLDCDASERRSYEVFRADGMRLVEFSRRPWNAYPAPRFDANDLANAMLAVMQSEDDSVDKIVRRARTLWRDRAHPSAPSVAVAAAGVPLAAVAQPRS